MSAMLVAKGRYLSGSKISGMLSLNRRFADTNGPLMSNASASRSPEKGFFQNVEDLPGILLFDKEASSDTELVMGAWHDSLDSKVQTRFSIRKASDTEGANVAIASALGQWFVYVRVLLFS
uniref:Uncharacterized protein n=1 Tax=Spongospora subterranea TaxID=70186 RepID=A0A0H5QN64_9EUKA|eukprot:CRZ03630.1 hypothetical protein [Spongospora subterranea]